MTSNFARRGLSMTVWMSAALAGALLAASCGGRERSVPPPGDTGADGGGVAGGCSGAEVSGRCLTELASGDFSACSVLVDATSVYWRSVSPNLDGNVMKTSVNGGDVTVLFSDIDTPEAIALNAANIYWTMNDGRIMDVAVQGGMPNVLATTAPFGAASIALHGATLYWTDEADLGSVFQVPSLGGVGVELATMLNATAIAVDATNVYCGISTDDGSNGMLVKLPRSGGPSTTLATGQSSISGVVVDAENVYWTSHDVPLTSGTVTKVALAGGAPVVIASNLGRPDYPALDGATLYWSDGVTDSIMKAESGGGTPIVVASGRNDPCGVAIDATSVYWAEAGPENQGGAMMKLTPK